MTGRKSTKRRANQPARRRYDVEIFLDLDALPNLPYLKRAILAEMPKCQIGVRPFSDVELEIWLNEGIGAHYYSQQVVETVNNIFIFVRTNPGETAAGIFVAGALAKLGQKTADAVWEGVKKRLKSRQEADMRLVLYAPDGRLISGSEIKKGKISKLSKDFRRHVAHLGRIHAAVRRRSETGEDR